MREILYDATKESLLKFWVEINENPRLARGSLAFDIWKRIQELDEKETQDKLTVLRKELKGIGQHI